MHHLVKLVSLTHCKMVIKASNFLFHLYEGIMKQGLASTESNIGLLAIQINWHLFVITDSSVVNNR